MKKTGRKMSVWQLTVITAANMMGSGIIMLPTKLAQVGAISLLSWFITALGSMALAMAFVRCGMYSNTSGGMGGYAEYRFGKRGHFMTSYAYAVSIVIANVAIAIAAVGYGSQLLEASLSPVQICMFTTLLLWLGVILNFRGAKYTGRLSTFTIFGAIIPILGLGTIGWFFFDPQMFSLSWNPRDYGLFDAVSNSIALTLWAFLGLESAAVNMNSVENPQKNVPLATFWGTLLVAVIYILSTNVIAGIVPNADLLQSSAPFGLAYATMFNDTIGKIMMGMMVVSCCGSLFTWQFTLAQIFKTTADKGFFPKIFSQVSKSDTPVKGMLIIVIMQSFLALMTISPTLSAQFEILANLAVVTNIIPYILCSIASMTIMKQASVTGGTYRRGVFFAAVALAYCVYALYTIDSVTLTAGGIALLAGMIGYQIVFDYLPSRQGARELPRA